MSALKWGHGRRRGARRRGLSGASFSLDRFVLPRWLRRPVRLFTRLGEGDLKAPPYSATMLSAALLASSLTYGGYVGGHLDAFVQGVTARTGFAVDQIKVAGNHETSEIDILDKLDLDGWTSLIGFDDFNLATFTDPQITVVSQPVSEIGRAAARLLFDRLSGKTDAPRKVRFETKLIVRGSVSRRG